MMRPTRFPALRYRQDGPILWRIYDCSDSLREAAVGPQYCTKGELLADLERYATEGGWTEWTREDARRDGLTLAQAALKLTVDEWEAKGNARQTLIRLAQAYLAAHDGSAPPYPPR